MPLSLHLGLHVLLSLAAGLIAVKITKEKICAIIAALLGGVLVDVDHFIDYFLQFGMRFDLASFIQGDQFSDSGKLYIFFHAWEYVIIFLAIYWFVKSNKAKALFLGLALGLFFHLCFDVVANDIPFTSYAFLYRLNKGFSLEELTNQIGR